MYLLLTRPRYDRGTHYLFYWAEILIKEAKKRGSVKSLDKENASKNKFRSYLKKLPITTVIINGHGNEYVACGHDDEKLISINDGDDLFIGKNIFIRACSSGAILGPELIRRGALGFVGYVQPFAFLRDPDSFHNPLGDWLAGPILECSNEVGLSLIRGKSAQEAHQDSLNKYQETINKLSSSKSAVSYVLPYLLWNMSIQVAY